MKENVENVLAKVGLKNKGGKMPYEMSGGEQQRVDIARALLNNPKLILADEPTGNLDSANGRLVLDLLLERNKRAGTTLVLVTHDVEVASRADRKIVLKDGQVVEDTLPYEPASALAESFPPSPKTDSGLLSFVSKKSSPAPPAKVSIPSPP